MTRKWGKKEIEILTELYPYYIHGILPRQEIQKVFPERTWEAISRKANRLNISNKELYPTYDNKEYHRIKKIISI